MLKQDKFEKNTAKTSQSTFLELADLLLVNLPHRSQEIIKKRFGLSSGKKETLEHIGSEYNVTRERVRQIIADAIKKISKFLDTDVFKMAEEKIILEISQSNGIISKEKLVEKLGSMNSKEAMAVVFFADCSKKIFEIKEDGLVKNSWTLSMNILDEIKEVSNITANILDAAGAPLTDFEISKKIIAKRKELDEKQALHFLDVLVGVTKNKFNKWGFCSWMEVNPRGTRERIYLALKENKKPLHFRKITELIDKLEISKKKSHPQTVHNELIKDERFVLIGRGIYALREWGYTSGTIKDVLMEILKKNKKAMSKEDLIAEATKARRVKKTTIMINLSNKNLFSRRGDKYALKNQ